MPYATTSTARRVLVLAGVLTAGLLVVRCGRSKPQVLAIERGSSGCLGTAVFDTFEIEPGGTMTWRQEGRADRTVQLTAAQRAAIDHARTLRGDDARAQEFHHWVRVDGGEPMPARSSQAAALNTVLADATMTDERRWIEGLGESQLLLAARIGERRYRVAVDRDGVLHVKRGSAVLVSQQLDDAQRMALYQHLLGRVAVPAGAGDMVGRLVVAGAMLPVSLGRGTSARLAFVWAALRNADDAP